MEQIRWQGTEAANKSFNAWVAVLDSLDVEA